MIFVPPSLFSYLFLFPSEEGKNISLSIPPSPKGKGGIVVISEIIGNQDKNK